MAERGADGQAGSASPGPTLDQMFRRTVNRKPDATALVDPADKTRITGTPPRRLTFAQADRAISAMARHLVHGGLPVGSIVALQMPNTVEMVIALLGVIRAGCIAAPLPQLWRQADLSDALNRTGARALVCGGLIDGVDHGALAMNAAVEAFSIRYVAGFGALPPDGVMPLDDVFTQPHAERPARAVEDARLAAVVTFDITAEGRRAVPRTHMQMTAGGLALTLESGLAQDGPLLGAMPMTSFAGLAATLMAWLLSGETLVLHHPFDDAVLRRQLADEGCAALVLPAPVALRLDEAGALAEAPKLRQVIGLWRNPEQVVSSAPWTSAAAFTDAYLFGEAGLFAARRGGDGLPAPIRPGPFGAPRTAAKSPVVGETLLTPKGTLALRGPMVPVAAYAPPRSPQEAFTASTAPDHVDTGYAARFDKASGTLTLTAPPVGMVGVGGYRFRAEDLRHWAQNLGTDATLAGLPDRLAGHRLAGRATDNPTARAALAELGLNPLVCEAFRDRTPPA
ncbi:MAG: long-chain fatty acid--CoA ligase [Xanthobacteraceae bacterium]|nr:MAG: long-chain fatty acid--CoA ligase [Xanthobacteraceae bacterium]